MQGALMHVIAHRPPGSPCGRASGTRQAAPASAAAAPARPPPTATPPAVAPAAWIATAAAVNAPTLTLMPLAHFTAASQFTGLADLLTMLQRHNRGRPAGERDAAVSNASYPTDKATAARLGLPASAADRTPPQKAQLAQALREAKVVIADLVLDRIVAPGRLDEVRHRDAVDDHTTRRVLVGVRTDKRCGPSHVRAHVPHAYTRPAGC